jgi:hypothetical protein
MAPRTKAPPADPVKDGILASVQHHLVNDPGQRPPLLPHPEGVHVVNATPLGKDKVRIVVVMDDGTSRTFTVAVTEDES